MMDQGVESQPARSALCIMHGLGVKITQKARAWVPTFLTWGGGGVSNPPCAETVVAAKRDESGKWVQQRFCVDLRGVGVSNLPCADTTEGNLSELAAQFSKTLLEVSSVGTSDGVPETGESSSAGAILVTKGWHAPTLSESIRISGELAEMEAAGVITRCVPVRTVQMDPVENPPLPYPLPEKRGEHWSWPHAGTPSYHLNHAQWRQRFCDKEGRYKPEALADAPTAVSAMSFPLLHHRSTDYAERDAQAAPAEHTEEPGAGVLAAAKGASAEFIKEPASIVRTPSQRADM